MSYKELHEEKQNVLELYDDYMNLIDTQMESLESALEEVTTNSSIKKLNKRLFEHLQGHEQFVYKLKLALKRTFW